MKSRVVCRSICALAGAVLVWSGALALAAGCPPDTAPATAAPYVAYRSAGDLVFVSGQIGVDPSAPGPVPDFETQMRTALARLDAVLAAAGSAPGEVLRATVYLADPADMATMNRLYRGFFEDRAAALPARSLVPGLDFGNAIAVEIDVVARRLPCN
ncbi:MAG: RidA family protein [Pseudomonadales bacterium]